MDREPRTLDRSKLRTQSAGARKSLVSGEDAALPHRPGDTFATFLEQLPRHLAARDLRDVIDAWAEAWSSQRTVLWGFGAHLIKLGLGPLLVDLLERGAINALMLNGAGCVHDLELAMLGRTSEDVDTALDDGSFGNAKETAEALNAAISRGAERGLGMGESVGREILDGDYPHSSSSILATAVRLQIPVTVHVAIGSDVHHIHPSADGAALGATSYKDFEILAGLVSRLENGVFFNVGSAVILPEVFLKALALARNLGHRVERFSAVNLDFLRQYRAERNVVDRPTRLGGQGFSLLGPHEILVPLLAAGVIEAVAARSEQAAPAVREERDG